jgi:hypothetical protein
MPVSGLSTGIDVSFVINDPNTNSTLNLGRVTGFDRRQNTSKLESDAINGPPIFGTTYRGWSGTITFERNGPQCDQFFAQLEANYYNGVTILTGTILETIKEISGLTQWRYNGVDFDFSDAGRITQRDFIKMTVTWRAQTRVQA